MGDQDPLFDASGSVRELERIRAAYDWDDDTSYPETSASCAFAYDMAMRSMQRR